MAKPEINNLQSNNDAKTWLVELLRQNELDVNTTNLDYNEIIESASFNGVLSLLYFHLVDQQSSYLSQTDFIDILKSRATRNIILALARKNELRCVLSLLNASDIKFVLMKGEVLAYTHYADSYLRSRCDTDILFSSRATAEMAWLMLRERGYVRDETIQGEFVGFQFSCHKKISNDIFFTLDVHSKLNDYLFFANTFHFEELYRDSVSIKELGKSARGLKPVHALLHACMHRVANMPRGIQSRLIWVYDFHLLCEGFTKSEWRELVQLARQKKLSSVCLDGLKEAHNTFGTVFPRVYKKPLEEYAKLEDFTPKQASNRLHLYYISFLSNSGFANKLKQLRETFFPSIAYMKLKYKPKHIMLLPYFYCKRAIVGFLKYM